MTSDAQKRAKQKYRKNSKFVSMEFRQEELPLYEFAKAQGPSMQGYLKQLLREDMEHHHIKPDATCPAGFRFVARDATGKRCWKLFVNSMDQLYQQALAKGLLIEDAVGDPIQTGFTEAALWDLLVNKAWVAQYLELSQFDTASNTYRELYCLSRQEESNTTSRTDGEC